MGVFLKWYFFINGVVFLTIIMWRAFLDFDIPQRIFGFFFYHTLLIFSPDKLGKYDFYTDGTWCRKTDETADRVYSIRLMEAQYRLNDILCREKYDVSDDSKTVDEQTDSRRMT